MCIVGGGGGEVVRACEVGHFSLVKFVASMVLFIGLNQKMLSDSTNQLFSSGLLSF